MGEDNCSACWGSGHGECANCGDGYEECACDDPEPTDCYLCEGTGIEPTED